MIDAVRWVRHDEAKRPLIASTGRYAMSTAPRTWTTYHRAARSNYGVGLGFVLNGDGIICIDIDHCLTDGLPDEQTAKLLARLLGTFVEISPSGDGLHVWGTASVARGGTRRSGNLEVYGTARYITVTGRRFAHSPNLLADLTEVVATLE